MSSSDDNCECVVWREGQRRCELWTILGSNRLRVYEADDLVLEEPFEPGVGWDRALALRATCGPDVRAATTPSR